MGAGGRAYHPLFVDLAGRRCLVVGGGPVAERKVAALSACGACVTVVSPKVTPALAARARSGAIRHCARRFRTADSRGAWLVYAATDEPAVNERIAKEATRRRIFVNVADREALCSFIAPAALRHGRLVVAVSTGGASPTLAKQVRRDLARTIRERRYAPMLRLLAGLRAPSKRMLATFDDRKRYFDRVAQGPVFRLMQAGKPRAAREEAIRFLKRQAAAHVR